MNKLTLLTIRDVDTTEELDFLNDICIVDDVQYEYSTNTNGYELENGRFYSDNENMVETPISFTAQINYDNDYKIKRFINRQRARFEIRFRINDKDCSVFCRKGDQVADINYHTRKQYDFTLLTLSRPFEITKFKRDPIPPEYFEGSEYDVGRFGEARYSTDGASNLTLNVTFDGRMADTNSYFTINGITKGENIVMFVNGQTITISNDTRNINFAYSNISGDCYMKVDSVMRADLLNTANISNFTFDFRQKANVITVTGLDNAEIVIYKGLNIL